MKDIDKKVKELELCFGGKAKYVVLEIIEVLKPLYHRDQIISDEWDFWQLVLNKLTNDDIPQEFVPKYFSDFFINKD